MSAMTPDLDVSVVRRLTRPLVGASDADNERLLDREWVIGNGLGGYSSASVAGIASRRYHGLLVSALPAPIGRMVMLTELVEEIRLRDGSLVRIGAEEPYALAGAIPGAQYLREFRLEMGLPVWRYDIEGAILEKRVLMPHLQNSVHVTYRLVERGGLARIRLWPYMRFRPIEAPVSGLFKEPYQVTAQGRLYEVSRDSDTPVLRLFFHHGRAPLVLDEGHFREVFYRVEQCRGYDCHGLLWNPGYFRIDFADGPETTLVASTEPWDAIFALDPERALKADRQRSQRLMTLAPAQARAGAGADLVLAADQFIITPSTRTEDAIRAHAAGDEVRTVIAGYHWFTDWGRDTMISLEGLALCTGRQREAGYILREFANHVKDGLIPNMFPEGKRDGLYHTADATLWFFHALDRYLDYTSDRLTLRYLLPTLREIIQKHIHGTRFGIGMDPADGLLRQGEEGYQLTWMDAKMKDWVVTPRRGKAVEINALWYNALCLMERWLRREGDAAEADALAAIRDQCRQSFNARFWHAAGGHLYDVVDGWGGQGPADDPACRPNQIFAVSLPNPVLDQSRWGQVLAVVERELLTPVGLRSLSPSHPEYKPKYFGDLRSRDAAYHQGTVWAWLIGPYVDAWLKVHDGDRDGARALLTGFAAHLDEAGVGSVSEIFDAEPPFTPRGCVAQAWSVAELLRCWGKTAHRL